MTYKRVLATFALLYCTLPSACRSQQVAVPWTWPVVPNCIRETPPATEANPLPTPFPQSQPTSPAQTAAPGAMNICTVRTLLLTNPNFEILGIETAREVNDRLSDDAFQAFAPGSTVIRFLVRGPVGSLFVGPNQLVRFSTSRIGAIHGNWWTLLGSVSDDGKTVRSAPEDTKALAITYYPSCVAYGDNVVIGAQGYFGIVAKAFNQEGGAPEFWFPAPAMVSAVDVRQVPGASTCG
jgi:hypothetical protein